MRFPRRPAATAAAIPIPRATAPDDGHLPMVDAIGHGFDMLRTIDIGRALSRSGHAGDLADLRRRDVVVATAYSADDITSYWPLMQRCLTIVLGVGLGPQLASRALTLGAVAYIDASDSPGDISGAFSDAFARIGSRRQREILA